ncbi:YicC family protein [Candidatus Desantisbacteria bacterium CG1_02_38_46]|uniref:YicC family protein n=3 Tax=unclassified Candidatus Desantisiibacteriota TaxID=3106372 RepID=A0A2H9P9T6_9BACT|nr:MAG: YicC family protein [Candidatus Desantisbacteria bacterium CG1_02_38_46]PIU52264.1 MAG: YicC family protein [Candidatus Desantisbacteria bacterium CG07_land_8_20_14_0_80_39_15]PIZ15064.1 MAG: YicC family protein [Candidatus Desantisbacteria bacterium CG_4_10_14_0_8_um_filter_39_17]
MIQSMTGYGQFKVKRNKLSFLIEARSLNSRFLDIIIKMPEGIVQLEDKIKKLVQNRIKRGRINLTINGERNSSNEVQVDVAKAKRYLAIFKMLKNKLKIPGEINLNFLLNFPQIFNLKEKEVVLVEIWPLLKKGIEKALDSLISSRLKEGNNIHQNLLKHITIISNSLKKIDEQIPLTVKYHKEKLERTLKEFLPELNLNHPRLVEELTLFATRVDISEEISRLKSHLQVFADTLNKIGPAGRRFEFIIQEMGREINTLSAKADDFLISSEAIIIKEELEKMREQVQNIE